jgi:hypothetical protein
LVSAPVLPRAERNSDPGAVVADAGGVDEASHPVLPHVGEDEAGRREGQDID